MKKYVFILSLTLLALVSTAQAEHQIAPGVIAIDEEGTAILERDGQNAALIIIGDAAKELAQKTASQPGAPLQCGKGYCSVGQISRSGQLSPFTHEFAKPNYFKNYLWHLRHPNGLSEALSFKDFKSEVYASPSQCQDQQGRNLPYEEVTIRGRTAEVLYNFLTVKAGPGERLSGHGKFGTDNLIFCEKIPQYDYRDLGKGNGPIYPPTYTEFSCYLNFDKSGTAIPRHGCNIYSPPTAPNEGGGSSAGGGGQK